MRVWTLHPKHLDAKGLVALWREALLAQKVLRGGTRGYRHHPQLARFRARRNPVAAIGSYLRAVAAEARQRGYAFDESKIAPARTRTKLSATRGQLLYERKHLLKKLRRRDPARGRELHRTREPEAHPLFRIVPGGIEPWEITEARRIK
ncbi:MAG: DNA lyase [Verrucomicrobia bacterium]|nr:DNA lyase [Verrucomicrobiota bacterium]